MIKMNASPGRINQGDFVLRQSFLFYGKSTEILMFASSINSRPIKCNLNLSDELI